MPRAFLNVIMSMKEEQLSIDIVGLAGTCSYALGCIEAELVNIKNKHGKRVAYPYEITRLESVAIS